MPKRRACQSQRERNQRLRQCLDDPDLRVKRGKAKLLPEIKIPEDGDWSEMIAQAERELRKAHAELRRNQK